MPTSLLFKFVSNKIPRLISFYSAINEHFLGLCLALWHLWAHLGVSVGEVKQKDKHGSGPQSLFLRC